MKWIGLVAVLAYVALVACANQAKSVKVIKGKAVVSQKAPITDAKSGHRVYPIVEVIDGKKVTNFYTAFRVGLMPAAPTNGPSEKAREVDHEAALRRIMGI